MSCGPFVAIRDFQYVVTVWQHEDMLVLLNPADPTCIVRSLSIRYGRNSCACTRMPVLPTLELPTK